MKTAQPDDQNTLFRLATEFINDSSLHLFLTGKAGTGKTTFLKHIQSTTYKKVLVAAPTGVAAINAGGVTLHSLFQLPFEPYIPGSNLKNAHKFGKAKIDLLKQLELLIIDEVSMLRVDMLDEIDATLRYVRKNREPFGGVQMLYIGDLFQLPPVAKQEEWEILKNYYDSTFFFHANVIKQVAPIYLELKKVYRQQDQYFIKLLNRIRNNELNSEDITRLNAQYQPNWEQLNDQKRIILTTHNYQADRINQHKLASLPTVLHQYKGELTGEFPESALPTDLNLALKVGAQIMFLKNDVSGEQRYYNGKLGEIITLTESTISILPLGATSPITIEKESWENVKYTLNKEKGVIEEEPLGSFKQYPIRTAWAITIHKSQGLTFDFITIDIANAFAAGQAYVALSRCTSLDGIILQTPIDATCIQTDLHAVEFAKKDQPIEALLPVLNSSKHQFWSKRLINSFEWKPLLAIIYEFEKIARDKKSAEFERAVQLALKMELKANEQQKIAKKFQQQLTTLLNDEHENKLDLIKDRCEKGAAFFYNQIREQLILPIQEHQREFSTNKKLKAYSRELVRIEENIILFANSLLTILFYNQPMVGKLDLPPLSDPKRAKIEFASKKSATTRGNKEAKTAKPPKRTTFKISLELYQAGKTVSEIALERSLAESTITGHLVSFISTGEVDVHSLVSQDKLEVILPLVQKHITREVQTMSPIMEQLGDGYTFGEIKAAIYYWLWKEENLNSQT